MFKSSRKLCGYVPHTEVKVNSTVVANKSNYLFPTEGKREVKIERERERCEEAWKQQKIETAAHKQEEVISTKRVLRFKGNNTSSARLKAALRLQQSYSYMWNQCGAQWQIKVWSTQQWSAGRRDRHHLKTVYSKMDPFHRLWCIFHFSLAG